MKKNVLAVCIMLFFFTLTHSQIHLISADNSLDFKVLQGQNYDMALINNNNTVVIGTAPNTANTSLKISLLDSVFDMNSEYFILYPIRSTPLESLQASGSVLYSSDNFYIFKTVKEFTFEAPVFQNFHICKISDKNIMPLFNNTKGALVKKKPLFITPDPEIQKLVDNVSDDSLWANLSVIVNKERYATAPETKETAKYLENLLKNIGGFDTVYQQSVSGYSPNVIAVKYGTVNKDSVFVLDGHYDVYAKGSKSADDNGSGTVATIEGARVLSKLKFRSTLMFALFTAEESGLKGSKAFVQFLVDKKYKVGGAINIDVALYRWDKKAQIDATYDDNSKDLFDSYIALVKAYQPSIPTYDGYNSMHKSSSDNASFWSKKMKALMTCTQLDDNHVSPDMHTSKDLITHPNNCRPALVAITRGAVAALATWGGVVATTDIGKNKSDSQNELSMSLGVSKNSIRITIPVTRQEQCGTLTVLNCKGQNILLNGIIDRKESSLTFILDRKSLAPGFYFFRYVSGEKSFYRSFMME